MMFSDKNRMMDNVQIIIRVFEFLGLAIFIKIFENFVQQ
jgi:hypothetical protein